MRGMRFQCDAPQDGRCWMREHVARLGEFDGCFPGRIGFTDVDGAVERNGFLLMIEVKKPGAHLPRGQEIMLEAVTRRSPGVQAVVVWGRNDFGGPLEWMRWQNGRSAPRRAVSLEQLKAHCREWYREADGAGR